MREGPTALLAETASFEGCSQGGPLLLRMTGRGRCNTRGLAFRGRNYSELYRHRSRIMLAVAKGFETFSGPKYRHRNIENI